jgi:D-xylose transport system substrate-binding protein
MNCLSMFCWVLILFFLNGCSNFEEKKVKIGYLIHATTNSRWQMDIKYLQERADQIGAVLIIRDAEGDENKQLKQANELLEEGVDALMVVAANQNTAAGIVREAQKHKVPIIAYDRMINNSDVDYMISFDYEEIGHLMVDYVSKKVSKGNCIMLWGDYGDANALRVKNGIEGAIAENSGFKDIHIIFKAYVPNWTYENAYHIVEKVLNFSPEKIDAVIACNVPLALGAADALKAHGYQPGEVVITAQDATINYIQAMVKNEVSMTFSKPMKEFAYGAIDIVVDLLKTGRNNSFDKMIFNGRKNVPSKLYSPVLVDRTNIEEELIASGIFSKHEVYGN